MRTLATNKSTISTQVDIVTNFTKDQGLRINTSKTEVVAFSNNNSDFKNDTINICGEDISVSTSACCLGYWWYRDLSCKKDVEMNISKARKAFFASGSIGAFQGHLNPLSSRCIYLTCVLPVLLYGSEIGC